MAGHPVYCLPYGVPVMWYSSSLIASVVFAPVDDTATVFTAEKRAEIKVTANDSGTIFYLHNSATIFFYALGIDGNCVCQ
ncbi:hypothetical protein FK515_28890 [Klebsiella pneumoniae]|nr:hypothetical protein [Klebsiella pneumoniae]